MSALDACSESGGDANRLPDGPSHAEAESDAREDYVAACTDYLKRQLLVYRNWPQRRYNELGYVDEVVFTDQNA